MKIYVKHILITTLLLPVFGCTESEFSEGETASLKAVYLNIHPSQYSFMSSADTERGDIEALGSQWNIQATSSWLTYSPSSGNSSATIQLSAVANLSADTVRTTVDFLRSSDSEWNFQMPISATQMTASPQLSTDHSYLSFDGKSSTQTITVTSNFDWKANTTNEWISLRREGNKLHITVTENNSGYRRWASVDISGKKSATINIEQQTAHMTISESSLNFGNTADTITLSVDAEARWTATSSNYWIQVSPTTGDSGKSTVEISVSANESISDRNGWIYFKIGATTEITIPVKQKGLFITTDANKIEFPSSGGIETLQVESNVSWIVSSYPEWLTVSTLSGTGNMELSLSAPDNNSVSSRSGRIYLSSPGLNLETWVNITQSGKEFSLSSTSLEFSDRAGSQSVTVTTDGTWESSTTNDWITVSPISQQGSNALTISVTENNTDTYKRGNVTVSLGNRNYDISVRQQGKYFTVADDDMNFTSKGGTIQLNVSTNDDWTATLKENAEWINLSQAQGIGEVKLDITAVDNPSVNERKDTLIVQSKNDKSVKVRLYQAARYLSATMQSVMFFSKGGTSDPITIETDGQFEIKSDGTWYTVNKISKNTFIVTAPANTTGQFLEGQITIQLTDLEEGEMYLVIPIIQIVPGGKFDKQEYNEDVDWGVSFDGLLNISVVGYSTDKSLDANGKQVFNLVIKGYTGDNWWGKALDGNGIFTKYGYGTDKNQDDHTNGNGSIGRNGYGDDANNDDNVGNNGNLTKGGFNNDTNWD